MTDTQTEFAELANAFISLANERLTSTNHTHVAMAMLAASARFNAYIVTMASGSAERAREEAPKATAFLVDRFQRTLASNLDDYIGNFDGYASPPPAPST